MTPFVPALVAATNKANIVSFYTSVVYLPMLSITQEYIASSKFMIVNKELESMWKASVTAQFKVLQK
jgi:hypothetical protein